MSAAGRQKSCACCGQPIQENDLIDLETLVDLGIRVVVVLIGHSVFSSHSTWVKEGDRYVRRSGPRD